MRCGAFLATSVIIGLTGCNMDPLPEQTRLTITIAAAANLTDVIQEIGQEFESRTGIHPVFSFGSTAQLAQQIENSAPFDVFAAADSAHVDQLERKGLLVPASHAVYACGVLALWVPASSKASVSRIEDLARPGVRFVAIAKPELAPYGAAAVETLQRTGLWKQVQGKVVYAENISAARQYGSSGNADAVFTAYSLVRHEPGKVITIEDNFHQPIDQELGIVAKSKHQDASRKFVSFVLSTRGQELLTKYGYQMPAVTTSTGLH